jgi:hypothetical protein
LLPSGLLGLNGVINAHRFREGSLARAVQTLHEIGRRRRGLDPP